MSAAAPIAVHATALVVGEAGILIRGPSGSGKSSLALLLLYEARRLGQFARLVGDDRILLLGRNGHVIATPHPAVAGLLERRTQPFAHLDHEPRCILRLVVELYPPERVLPRWSGDEGTETELAGVATLPLLCLQAPLDSLACRYVLDTLIAAKPTKRH